MSQNFSQQFLNGVRRWWKEQAHQKGVAGASSLLARELWGFLRDSTPARQRQRYGDMEYDWEYRVNTTSGTVGWRERLLGVFHSAYQPTDPAMFREMMAALPIQFEQFSFVDLGSGKGRTLLLASEYPFQGIVGVEILPELHRAAEENIRAYRESTGRGGQIHAILADACEYDFPETPLVVYLFNPLPEAGLRRVIGRLAESLSRVSRPVWIVYHNPVLDAVVSGSQMLESVGGTGQYSVYRTRAAKLSSPSC
ncbi:MAG TPA: class I SAM-dependent methyltransferase [Terriglobales bacterium]